ncbi:MAG: DUF58 domain-containing protein [Phycisphaerales bacterium]|nr:DUF58 domain-containing protein [Phycisphaerales bacterium]
MPQDGGINGGSAPLRAEQYLAPETLMQLAPFELRAKAVAEGAMNGMHKSPRQGSAVEFSSHRQYAAGDSVRHLDWKVFGRSDKLYVKQFRQETNLDVVIMVDASASMRFGTLGVKQGWGGTAATKATNSWTKFDHATACAAAIAYLCLTQRDRVGVGIFSDRLHALVKRSSARDQWRQIVHCLGCAPIDGPTDFERSIEQVLVQTQNRALFCLLSDFMFPIDSLRAGLARLKHAGSDAILLTTLDRQELRFDFHESAPFRGLEDSEQLEVDVQAARHAYLEELQTHLSGIGRAARGAGFDQITLDTHESVGPALSALLAKREAFDRRRSP